MKAFEGMKTFFSVLIKFFSVVLIMIVIALASFEGVTYYLTGNLYDFKKKTEQTAGVKQEEETKDDNTATKHKDSYNSLIFYVDEARNYFDVRISMLNTKTGYEDILLLPACSRISVSGQLMNSLNEEVDVTGNAVTLSEIYRSYNEDKYLMMQKVISEAFGVEFECYDVMEEEDLEEMLSMTGDVTCELKNKVTYRNKQNVLRVLESGEQELNVKQAIAYMSYLNGSSSQEVNRLENIASYLTAYFGQILSEKNAKEVYKKYAGLAETQGNRDDDKITSSIGDMTVDAISIRVLQGSEENGAYTIDSQKAKLQISGLMTQAEAYNTGGNGSASSTTEDDESTGDSRGYSIELFNAGYISGLAGSWRDYLQGQGYEISMLDNYREGTLATTEIIVNKEGLGKDFLKYFPDAQIKVEDIPTGGDIRIYLGTDSAYMVPGYEDTKPDNVVLDEEGTTETETTETEVSGDE